MTEGARRFPSFDPPLSIADSPACPGLSLIANEAGDFTSRIGELPRADRSGPTEPVAMSPSRVAPTTPSCRSRAASASRRSWRRCVISRRAARGDRQPLRQASAAGTPETLACLEEIAAAAATLDFRTCLSSEPPGDTWRGETGPLDRDRLSDMLSGLDAQRTVALLCGPGPMVTAVADDLIDLGMPMHRIMYAGFDCSEGAARIDRRLRRRFMLLALGLAVGVAVFVALSA